MTRIRFKCPHCGGTEIMKDAWASWDEDKQEWVLFDTFEYNFCQTCEGECHPISENINDKSE